MGTPGGFVTNRSQAKPCLATKHLAVDSQVLNNAPRWAVLTIDQWSMVNGHGDAEVDDAGQLFTGHGVADGDAQGVVLGER